MAQDRLTIAKKYAGLLFEVAEEKSLAADICQDLETLKEVFQTVPELAGLFARSEITAKEKQALAATLTDSLNPYTKNFVQVVVDYQHMSLMPDMIDAYIEHYHLSQGILDATATTAVPMETAQIEKLATKFAEVLQAKQVKLANIVDPGIIGGVILESQHQVYDGSIARQLQELKQQLL